MLNTVTDLLLDKVNLCIGTHNIQGLDMYIYIYATDIPRKELYLYSTLNNWRIWEPLHGYGENTFSLYQIT